tara:strand:- start:225 stop:704 length:480 start_codon:yes stop_codon:yes gene_type:complete
MEKHPICISRTIKFSEKFLGVKCRPDEGRPNKDYPFYAINKKKINIEYIKEHGICEVGFFNILRRFNKLPIPGSGRIDYYPEGGAASWIYVFKKKYKKFISGKKYPKGSLLVGDKKMAMYLGCNQIIHCCSKENIIVKSEINDFNFLLVCYPKNWILME